MEPMRFKVVATVAILLFGGMAALAAGTSDATAARQSQGVVIDFAQWDAEWTDIDLAEGGDPIKTLQTACASHGYGLELGGDGRVMSVNGVGGDAGRSWNLWAVMPGDVAWTMLPPPYAYDLSEYTVSAWAYRAEGEEPTVAVDAEGSSIYGYPQKERTVSLAPAITEIVASVGGVKTLVGTDSYSVYPQEVARMRAAGDIAVVGDFTTPNFEAILKAGADAVFCDGAQYNHIRVCEKLRKADVCAVLLYEGESIGTILDNIFVVGRVMGYHMRAAETIGEIAGALDEIGGMLESSPFAREVGTMIALSGDKSPWVSGGCTYADGVLSAAGGRNVFGGWDGWVHLSSEEIMKPSRNPSKIIITSLDCPATQEGYDRLVSSLSQEWRNTDAYRDGEIYLIAGAAGEMAHHPGPRVAQFAELVARMLNPEVFGGLGGAKFVGDDYEEHLTITKSLGFD